MAFEDIVGYRKLKYILYILYIADLNPLYYHPQPIYYYYYYYYYNEYFRV